MKKALIISYYWPPAGGGGVQRVAKFCKYMREFDWEPVVLTVKDGNYPSRDESLIPEVAHVANVYKAATREPHALYRRLSSILPGKAQSRDAGPAKATGTPSWFSRLGETVRLNLFIPDSRIGWRRSAQRVGEAAIAEMAPDVIFSSAPPYTPHLIAQHLSAQHRLPWVADFRDPWLENHAYNTAPRLGLVKRANCRLEQGVLRAASRVTCANPGIQRLVAAKLEEDERDKCVVITNGYDRDDLSEPSAQGEHFVISYFGTIYGKGFPIELFSAIGGLIRSNPLAGDKLRLRVVGDVHPTVAAAIHDHVPASNLEVRPYVPHEQMLSMLLEPQVLVLVINEFPHNTATVPGKMYEYMPTGNPILGIGPSNGDAANMLHSVGAGTMIDHGNQGQAADFIAQQFKAWQNGTLNCGLRLFDQFDRKHLAGQLTSLFNEVAPS